MPSHLPSEYQIRETDESFEDDWTRDLPLCPMSRMATLTNQIYHANGYKSDEHPFFETGFNFSQDGWSMYGLFSGHGSARCAKFAAAAFPAELVFGNLLALLPDEVNADCERVLLALREAWVFVDKQYIFSLNDLLAERTQVESINENLGSALLPFSVDSKRLAEINRQLRCFASGIVCVVGNDRLFITYAGECVAVLATQQCCDFTGGNDLWDVSVLTCSHNINNDDEKLRLGEQVLVDLSIAEVHLTRFLGHPALKEFSKLKIAPEHLVLSVNSTWKVLVLASPGVFETLADLNPQLIEVRELAKLLCYKIREEFTRCVNSQRETSCGPLGDTSESGEVTEGAILNNVAQNVVEDLGKTHFRAFCNRTMNHNRRPDMTLIVRVFDETLLRPSRRSTEPERESSGEPRLPHSLDAASTSSLERCATPSVTHQTLSSSMSSIHNSTASFEPQSNEPILSYVDFTDFIERMSADPNVPRDWL